MWLIQSMKFIKLLILVLAANFLICSYLSAQADPPTRENPAPKKDAHPPADQQKQEKDYEKFAAFTLGRKEILRYLDFLALPKKSKPLAPIHWPGKLPVFKLEPAEKSELSLEGAGYRWSYNSFEDIVKLAVYPSPTESQLALTDVLAALPKKPRKSDPNDKIGDASFHTDRDIYFVRKNVLAHAHLAQADEKARSTLTYIARVIDKVIIASTVRLWETAPYDVALSPEKAAAGDNVILAVTPREKNRPFTVRCTALSNPAQLQSQPKTTVPQPDETQTITLTAQTTGPARLKIYICEPSGMVWPFYKDFRVTE